MDESKILKGKTVLLTRADNSALRAVLEKQGARVLELPLIKVDFDRTDDEARQTIEDIGTYNWITFSSANGVRGFFKIFFGVFDDIRCLGIARIACVGEATAAELKKVHIKADLICVKNTSMEMAADMSEFETLENLNVLCVLGNLSDRQFMEELEKKHRAIVDDVVVYHTEHTSPETSADLEEFKREGADVVVFASPSAVDSFAKNAKILMPVPSAKKPKIVCIGPTTSKALDKYSMKLGAQSENPSAEALSEAVKKCF